MESRKRKRDGDQSQSTLFSCWSAAKRTCGSETPETDESVTRSVAVSSVDSVDVVNLVDEEVLPDDETTDDGCPPSETECAPAVADDSRLRDIGQVLKPSMSSARASSAVADLSPGDKYLLLSDPFVPDPSYPFPRVNIYGCNRSFQYSWLGKYPWLVYSKELDGGFCRYCTLFAKNMHLLGVLVRTLFRQWVKVNKVLENHAKSKYHFDATESAMEFKRSIEQPEVNVDIYLNEGKRRRIAENRHIVKCAAETVLYCGRQCIALRGHSEKLSEARNPGNFLAMLKVLAAHDPSLEAHLKNPRMRNATYLSSQTQNDLAEVIGKDFIQKSILQEVRDAPFFSVIVDEVTSHNKEIMPLV